jgi:hypothetical protein
VGALFVAQRMKREGRRGSIVALLCDSGERYAQSYYNPRWYIANAIDRHQADVAIASAVAGGPLPDLSTTERGRRMPALPLSAIRDQRSGQASFAPTPQP